MGWSERVFGPPPPKDAAEVDKWRYVRRIYIRLLPFTVPMWVLLAAAGGPTWLLILVGVGALTWVPGFLSVNRHIRRARGTAGESQ